MVVAWSMCIYITNKPIFTPITNTYIYMKASFGAVVVAGSGKLGGHVASRNLGGAYFRTRVKPLNPQTPAQIAQRYQMSLYSKNWNTLTAAEQAAWNAYAAVTPLRDRLGNSITVSGKNLYIQCNINLALIGGSAITTPPSPAVLSEITGLNVASLTVSAATIGWTSGAIPAGENWVVRATRPVNAGVSYVKNQYRIIAVLAPAATSPANIFTAYSAKFGAPVSGQKIFFSIQQIDNAGGLVGVPYVVSAIVT